MTQTMRDTSSASLRARLSRGRRAGFSLVEIVVAMMLLSVTLLALAALMSQVARQARATEVTSHRTAVLTHHVNYFTALPYAALTTTLSGCETLVEVAMPHERCVTITQGATSRAVKIKVTPSNTAYRPDSAMFNRSAPPVNYFNVN